MSDDPDPEPSTEGRRSRRARTKVIDYAKEQEFSDEDLFEDVPEKETAAVTPAPKKKKGNRKSKGTGRKSSKKKQENDVYSQDPFEDGAEDDYVPSKPVYTEKGYDPALPPIRERFPFLPEYELDGSPRIDLIVGRRPVDEKDDKKKDLEDNSSDNDDDGGFNTADDDDDEDFGGRQRKGRRGGKRNNGVRNKKGNKKESGKDFVEYEYLVKYKNLSYMHLEWKSGADLESMNKSAKTIYRRYLKKVTQGQDEDFENPDFDPSFVVVQKVLAEEEQQLELEVEGEELIKWEKQREKELAEEDLSEEEREMEEERQKEEERFKEDERRKEEERLRQEKKANEVEEKVEGNDKVDGEIGAQKDTAGDDKQDPISDEKKGRFQYYRSHLEAYE
jgi:hypothetical protein